MENVEFTIDNVNVKFPFKPYPCQFVYMEKVIQCLQQGSNAILESPTGTGKTLCLLCATLAWREEQLRCRSAVVGEGNVNVWDTRTPSGVAESVPKIIYASRTHSQLSQVIRELKNTSYRPRVSIIGSREQMCIHPEVQRKETNTEKVHLCRAKVKANSCTYYNNVDAKRLQNSEPIMDIEDLVLAGTRHRMCPYYLARELKQDADIIFMPYNYLLDAKTRKMHGVDVRGAVVILDEAHNIEKVCEEATSFDLTSLDIAYCIADVDHLLQMKMDELEGDRESASDDDLKALLNLKEFFLTLEKTLDSIPFQADSTEEPHPGDFILTFFASAGLTRDTWPAFVDQCGLAITLLTSESGRTMHRSGINMQKMLDLVKVVFNHSEGIDLEDCTRQYKVHLKVEKTLKKAKSDVWTVPSAGSDKKDTRVLGYWCFSPGLAMKELLIQGVRSLILTSGTLSPLSSFSSELQVEFPVSYEGPHVIQKDQVFVGVVCKGCDNVPLNSSFAKRSSEQYQNSLGNTIVNFARIVPHGMLVFFPSYSLMYSFMDAWKANGIAQRIESHKPIFLEPKKKADLNPTMDAFYEKIADPKYNGAAFFAVCRGKVSEGLDFADMHGRAVIITGLPYAPRMDPKVDLKMKYLDDGQHQKSSLSGRDWYNQQAYRAVNQAVGRVIRHRMDYGAIILCDERFASRSSLDQLSVWLRPHAKVYDRFGQLQRDLTQFFKSTELKFGVSVPQPKAPVMGGGVMGGGAMGGASTGGLSAAAACRHDRSTLPPVQKASVIEDHMQPSTSCLVPQASLAKIKMVSSAKPCAAGLVSALDECETGSCRPGVCNALRPSNVFGVDHTAITSEPKSAAKRIVIKEKQADRTSSAEDYIAELKTALSVESFEKFRVALRNYKQNKDINLLMANFREIFKQPSMFYLLQGMHRFVNEQHREAYGAFYQDFTGRTLGKTLIMSTAKKPGSQKT